jgi:5-methyltetrahydrofolate--homocysteine methyltransferase
VKIEPAYTKAPIIHVHDASARWGRLQAAVRRKQRQGYWDELTLATPRSAKPAPARKAAASVSLDAARANGFDADAGGYQPGRAAKRGPDHDRRCLRLADLVDYIDWTPFFFAWEHEGQLSRHSRMTPTAARRRAPVQRRADHAQAHGRGKLAEAARRGRPVAGPA